ncbi:bifunctional precorrin-2 dehydrogenase/sirohydrochlorin ferrochelatase [Bacillus sp. H-16]|uniref:precorrin-2 dehydrogenase/sirohydrochlorin ferrochelatase family protein n=1 Tax=Alteribacter salitolerans TaxID=2912333 RepID=UPI001962FA53|nr:bifunctional precorrin-2 dehydrogenase/sirohydrochlorin ferrochelatase [Alteribacter salitolerans]MBM7096969.1 bifunctional precorrin-2 dehydrogenase/sirohydrochlorin ferrochelatase [Alteribacter salitolerans]
MGSPLVLKLNQKPVLVIGGGSVAERKTACLVKGGAGVTLISPAITKGLESQLDQFCFYNRALTIEDVAQEYCSRLEINWRSFFMVVVATNSPVLNEKLSGALQSYISLINVVDNLALSTFYFPAVVDRGALKLSVTTSGKSPVLAKKIRGCLEDMFGMEYDAYLEELHYIRSELKKIEADPVIRKRMLEERTQFPL